MLIIIFISFLYFVLIFSFTIGWFRIVPNKEKFIDVIDVSIIIAAKNEEKNISGILTDIKNQEYSKEKYEVFIIDDNSVDKTYQIVEEFCKENPNFKIYHLKKSGGKKVALEKGIKLAKAKLIITTDADCRVGTRWLKSISDFYISTKAKMIIAPVVYETGNKIVSFANFQALEFMSLSASTAGAVGINSPIMCNGANLIFEKNMFYEFENPYKAELTSGDDVFLMLNVKKKYPKQIMFLKDTDSVVYTKSSENLKSLINQRIRWASKSLHYKDFYVNSVGIIVLLTNLTLFITFFGAIFQFLDLKFFIFIFIVKIFADLPLLSFVSKYFSKLKLLVLFLPLQFIYFFYVIIISTFTLFVKYKWK